MTDPSDGFAIKAFHPIDSPKQSKLLAHHHVTLNTIGLFIHVIWTHFYPDTDCSTIIILGVWSDGVAFLTSPADVELFLRSADTARPIKCEVLNWKPIDLLAAPTSSGKAAQETFPSTSIH